MFDYVLGRCVLANAGSSPILSSSYCITTNKVYIASRWSAQTVMIDKLFALNMLVRIKDEKLS
jgi:hypothetical protein